ncbi:MAG: DNA mismatch repair protein MutS [Ignavibacteria bacterium GWF2_33_9]|nr:MAG: DNA mismatch repair protein MutS [Ignavibacteria bacterium GWF2_33_9]
MKGNIQDNNNTPLTRQYNQIKAKYPDTVLLFRLGDFFETFNEDAVITSKVCGLTLTKRNNGKASEMPLAGFPHHQLDNYLPKLVRAGYRVAVCDQLEDPKNAKGIVKRGVTEVVTPGVAISEKLLDSRENNFILSIFSKKYKSIKNYGIAFADISTGEIACGEIPVALLNDVLENIAPKEVLFSKEQKEEFQQIFGSLKIKTANSRLEEWFFDKVFAEDLLHKHFQVNSLKGFGIENFSEGIIALGALLHYLTETQQGKLEQIKSVSKYNPNEFILLDYITRKNLEILFSLNELEPGNTLLKVIDRTKTPMGGRLLKQWISQPLLNVEKINQRLDTVEEFFSRETANKAITELLTGIGDMERLVSKISVGKINPRDYINLKTSLLAINDIKELRQNFQKNHLLNLFDQLEIPDELITEIEKGILDEPTLAVGIGRIFKKGYNAELDEYVELKYSGKEWIANFQEKERERTGINNLKVSFNSVFGYYIEVSRVNSAKVPDDYERRQTLTNSERYITPELKNYEVKIFKTEDELFKIEQKLLGNLRELAAKYIQIIQKNSQTIAQLDCLNNFANISREYNYVKPTIDDSYNLHILHGRHPVIEKSLKIGENYTPNSTYMNPDDEMIHIITGPNMSGKSSYLRQVGLIVLLGQIGCFVPATEAHFGYFNKIFTRVGASDNIVGGESTFMVEMQEAANILNNADKRSLILLDEVGRGTATFDGISIAWAIAEYIHNVIKAKTLFATHYHELQQLENLYNSIKNYQVEVVESGKDVIFTHKLARGGSDNSFGIHVAKIAGMPPNLLLRAEEILDTISADSSAKSESGIIAQKPKMKHIKAKKLQPTQMSIFEFDDEIRSRIQGIDPERISPMEALQILFELKKMAD